jgi:hypothetical protein
MWGFGSEKYISLLRNSCCLVILDVEPRNLIELYQCFRRTCCLYFHGRMEAAGFSKMLESHYVLSHPRGE